MYKKNFTGNGEQFVLHQWNKLGFWAHHMVAYLLVVIWYSFVRGYAVFRLHGDVWQNSINSAIVLATLWVLATVVLELLRQNLSKDIAIEAKLAAAMVVGSAISAFVGPTVNWFLGTSPPGLDIGTGRNDLARFFADRYPIAAFGYLVSVSPFWFVANWGWYAHREKRGMPAIKPAPTIDKSSDGVEEPLRRDNALPAFMMKLPPDKRGVLWGVTAEQHYLRIHTSLGDGLVLMRFSDAVDQLQGADGMQVHRSHWASKEGVRIIEEDKKKLVIRLKNDVSMPVSRPNFAAAKRYFADTDGEKSLIDAAEGSAQTTTA